MKKDKRLSPTFVRHWIVDAGCCDTHVLAHEVHDGALGTSGPGGVLRRYRLRAVAAGMPGADVKANGDVYFNVDEVEGCLAVVDKLMAL
jgi:hypothetical protein